MIPSSPYSAPLKSYNLQMCSSALGNGGSGSCASTLPNTTTSVVFGGGASVSITTTVSESGKESGGANGGEGGSGEMSYFSMRLGNTGGPVPTIIGHTLTGMSGRKALCLGGLALGRRSSGFSGGFTNALPSQNVHPSLVLPDAQPVKTSLGSGWILTVGGRRRSNSGIGGLTGRRPSDSGDNGTSWTKQYFLGQPPIRRAYHSAHRVVVGGIERIVVYGGEVGSMLSRPSSGASLVSGGSIRSRGNANGECEDFSDGESAPDDTPEGVSRHLDSDRYDIEQSPFRQKRRVNLEERLRDRIAALQNKGGSDGPNTPNRKYSRNSKRLQEQREGSGSVNNTPDVSEGSKGGYVKENLAEPRNIRDNDERKRDDNVENIKKSNNDDKDDNDENDDTHNDDNDNKSKNKPKNVSALDATLSKMTVMKNRSTTPVGDVLSPPRRPRSNSISYDMDVNSHSPASNAHKALKQYFKDDDSDDDGFLFVLDTGSWVWTAGTCATETFTQEEIISPDGEQEETSSRSFFPPARARHTLTAVTADGTYCVLFGGYKTKQQTSPHQFYNRVVGDNNYLKSLGTPLNDAWQLRTVSTGGDGASSGIRFLWRRMVNLGAPPTARWGHTAIAVGSGAVVIYGGSDEQVDLYSPRKDICHVKKALDECYVFHAGGTVDAGAIGGGGKNGQGAPTCEKGEGLWIRVPGSCGLGARVGASGTCVARSLLIFGGCRGEDDYVQKGGKDKTLLKDARHVDVKKLLQLNVKMAQPKVYI